MKLLRLAFLPLIVLLSGCAKISVMSQTYDLNRVKRIGVVAFEDKVHASLNGAEDIFTKYLMENGFSIIERARLEKVLEEQKISASGILSPHAAKKLGEVLGVDALFVGDIVSYTPEKNETVMIETASTYQEPLFKTEMARQDDGSYNKVIRQVGVKTTRERQKTPHVYTQYAQVGFVAKLVDVETGEIVWVGSYSSEGMNGMVAFEYAAQCLANQFRRDWDSAIRKKA